jgi:hypothetical protein
MKTTILGGFLVMLALWFGYNRGYHQGLQTERQAWESNRQWDGSIVKLGNDPPHFPPFLYKNPHVGIVLMTSHGRHPVNVPDPRNLPFK